MYCLVPCWGRRNLGESLSVASNMRAADLPAPNPTAKSRLVRLVRIVDAVVNAVGDGRADVGLQSHVGAVGPTDECRSRVVVTTARGRR